MFFSVSRCEERERHSSSGACRNIPHRFGRQLLSLKSLRVLRFHGDRKLYEPSLFITVAQRAGEEALTIERDKEEEKEEDKDNLLLVCVCLGLN